MLGKQKLMWGGCVDYSSTPSTPVVKDEL
jgi:hypothetical protein